MTADTITYKNRELVNGRSANAIIGVVFFILATTLGAYVRIPIAGSPVPITLQTFFVILSGAVLGKRLGSLSQAGYLIIGALGLPIFQAQAFGFSYILGPTGGYIVGFIFASYIVGYLLSSGPKKIGWVISSFAVGSLIIYIFGFSWLVYMYRIDFLKAATVGILPFVPGDIAKILLASVIYSGISERSKRIFSV